MKESSAERCWPKFPTSLTLLASEEHMSGCVAGWLARPAPSKKLTHVTFSFAYSWIKWSPIFSYCPFVSVPILVT